MALVNREFADPIDAKLIRENLNTAWLGKVVHYFPELTSTNDHLKDLASAGAETGTMVITDYQSKGRGRMSRRWIASKGSSLLFSLLFRPDWPIDRANWLVMMAGLAAKQSVQNVVGLSAQLKWPNDVLIDINGRRHKIAGILMDLQSADGEIDAAIVGVGINVNNQNPGSFEGSIPAASISDALGRPTPRLPLLTGFLESFERLYEAAQEGESPQPEWEKSLINIGAEVTISGANGDSAISGVALGTDSSGRLLVQDTNSDIHKISAGDVTVRG